jgi:hypothetical protein
MTQLQPFTWKMYAIWTAIGLIIYFGYGYRHSNEKINKYTKKPNVAIYTRLYFLLYLTE